MSRAGERRFAIPANAGGGKGKFRMQRAVAAGRDSRLNRHEWHFRARTCAVRCRWRRVADDSAASRGLYLSGVAAIPPLSGR